MRAATLFDLHLRPEGMALQLIDDDGRRVRMVDSFSPSVFLDAPRRPLARILGDIGRDPTIAGLQVVGPCRDRRDFWTNKPRPTIEVRVTQPFHWPEILRRLARDHPDVEFFNADLLAEQRYCLDRGLVPAGRCRYQCGGDGSVAALVGDDDEWTPEYRLPPLVIAHLEGGGVLRRDEMRLDWLSIAIDGEAALRWEGEPPAAVIAGLNGYLARHDPDVILSNGGDGLLMPLLFSLAARTRDEDGDPVPFLPDREPPPLPRQPQLHGRSFFSYGQVLYSAPDYPLYGRWHLDRANSFMISKTSIDGLVEVCRVSKIPIQRIGRRSIGTGITAIQLDFAYREGFLIPWKKSQPEAWKSAAQLLLTDRGGLVYQPVTGAHEDVVELDFVSMYPTIMSRMNVSPETVNCTCCRNAAVPELGYSLCEKRQGLVSRSLIPIIEKRRRLKTLRKAARAARDEAAAAVFEARQSALKWLLVCCFGYLGYRNARFGRIEAHEAVCAFARDRIMRAREVAEELGWRAIHMIVDCLWLQRPPGQRHLGPPTQPEIDLLVSRITEATGITIALEGVYRWIAFLPSRQDPAMPVPNRFFGVFADGTMKCRGIELRRSEQPPYVRDVQQHAIDFLLARATNLDAYRALVPDLLAHLREAEARLWHDDVPRAQLVIRRSLSKAPQDYRGNNMVAIAARQAEAAGHIVHAGETVGYLITRQGDPDPDRRVRCAALLRPEDTPDPAAYVRLVRRAFQTLLEVVGVPLDDTPVSPFLPPPRRRRDRTRQGTQLELF